MLLVLMPLSIIEIIFIYIRYNRMVVKPNAKIKITEYGANKLILDTMYYIEFPEDIPKYKGPVGYQGGLNQEQYFITNSWKYGEIIETYPIK